MAEVSKKSTKPTLSPEEKEQIKKAKEEASAFRNLYCAIPKIVNDSEGVPLFWCVQESNHGTSPQMFTIQTGDTSFRGCFKDKSQAEYARDYLYPTSKIQSFNVEAYKEAIKRPASTPTPKYFAYQKTAEGFFTSMSPSKWTLTQMLEGLDLPSIAAKNEDFSLIFEYSPDIPDNISIHFECEAEDEDKSFVLALTPEANEAFEHSILEQKALLRRKRILKDAPASRTKKSKASPE